MNVLLKWINQLNELVGRATSWLTVILMILVCFDVARRSLLGDTAAWIMELQWHLFALIFLFGAGYALKHDRHVRVDLFYNNLNKKDQAGINLFGTLFLLLPWCIILIIYSWQYAMSSWQMGESSPDPGGLPARYLIKFAIPVGMTLLFLQACALILESWLTIRQKTIE